MADYLAAKKLFETSCDFNNINACYNLGLMYMDGRGVKKDINKTLVFFEKACEGGLANACFNLGVIYENDTSVKATNKALYFFNKGCTLNDKECCLRYGKLKIAN